jgi:excinuclease ABC subunit A
MPRKSAQKCISLRGVRHNNLKNFDLDLPIGKLIVITGLSGSGKSSLAFDTLFAEGQRRYIETFSPYARQFFDRMDKPQVDSIEGIPPAIAIEQRNTVKTTRSTVGTMTEICDYAKVIWAHMADLFCRKCGRLVCKETPERIWQSISANSGQGPGSEMLVTFDLPLSEKITLEESLGLISKQGYQRLLVDDEVRRVEECLSTLQQTKPSSLTVVQDRLKLNATNRHRFIEACEQAYHFGKGKLALRAVELGEAGQNRLGEVHLFSNRFHCARCDIDYREPTPALFSFNHPLGACPTCRGFGRTIIIDYDLAIPDWSKTLAEGVVRPWQTGQGLESQQDLMKFCRSRRVPTDVPFEKLPQEFQTWVIEGDPGYGSNGIEWPHAWYGVKGYFRWLESKAYKMHVRVLLARYRAYQLCTDCQGTRFKPDVLLHQITGLAGAETKRQTISDFYQLSLSDALRFVESVLAQRKDAKTSDPLTIALSEVRSRLRYLNHVGLGYLTLDRPTKTLSGGETERVNLTTCLGSGLVNTLFVLDEPSVGLHPRDTDRLINILERLRSCGNTVVVVEHEPSVMRAADQIVDIGPGHGESGGAVVFQGTFREVVKSRRSLTGQYLGGMRTIEIPKRRAVYGVQAPGSHAQPAKAGTPNIEGRFLKVTGANIHNLKNLSVDIPLRRFVCVTGVSGSGKSTLIRDVLALALEAKLKSQGNDVQQDKGETEDSSEDQPETSLGKKQGASIFGWENISRVLLVDQSAIGRTPRSNPAVYIGAFDDIREMFAHAELAQQRGLTSSAFSFNSAQGQCERCRGAGFEKIEMQFLSDIFVICPQCNGRRYREHILEIKLSPAMSRRKTLSMNIAQLLDATVDEAVHFLQEFGKWRHALRAVEKLKLLQEVGLGYLRLGQPINTLSGGESQRLKLVSYLAEFQGTDSDGPNPKPALFLFDEPTTGLHFDDVRVLLAAFQRLVDSGHSVLVIEHNLELIKCADWIIDLGPDAGEDGGQVVIAGTPEQVSECESSHTGRALRGVL